MKRTSLLVVILIPLLFSCHEDEIKIDRDNLLIGTWNFSVYQDNIAVYTRSLEFSENHAYKFNPNGTLLERKIAGFCGTPPISYTNYDGSWTILNDTLLEINSEYWGGTTLYKLDVESVSENSLKVIMISGTN